MTEKLKNPLQPIFLDGDTPRFKENKIVRFLLDTGKMDLNDIARMVANGMFSGDDYMQFYQLIGTSLDGLPTIYSESGMDVYSRAEEIAKELKHV